MSTDRISPVLPRLLFGLGIVLFGTLFLMDNLDVLDARQYVSYWPALLIVVGIAYFVQAGSLGTRIWGGILIFVGSGLLLDRLGYMDFNPWNYWPLILVFAGINLVWQSTRHRITASAAAADEGSIVKAFAVMSGLVRSSASPDFRGGELSAIMGGVEIDLRRASIKEEAVIDVFAFWGGIEIKVPDDWTVTVKALPIMGGVDDKTVPPKTEPRKRLTITGTVVMGGVEIKN